MMRALLALFAGLAGWLLAPGAPTNVTAALAPRADSAIVTCRWTPPAGQVGTNIRLVPASDPALPTGDYADGLVYHQRGLETPLRTADTIRLGYPVAPVSVRCAVRAGDATFSFGPFAVSAPVTLAAPTAPPGSPATVTLARSSATLVVGDTLTLQATVRDASGTLLSVPVTWSASSPQLVATVDQTGRVTAAAPGLATITATAGAAGAIATITVTAPPPPPPAGGTPVLPRVTALRNLPPAIGFTRGGTALVAALPVDSAGDLLGTVVTWTIADSSVVRVRFPFAGVSQGVELRGLAAGTTTVTASVGPVAATTRVTISVPDTLPLVTFPPVAGVRIANLPSLWQFRWQLPIVITLYNRPAYELQFLGVAGDTVARGTLTVRAP